MNKKMYWIILLNPLFLWLFFRGMRVLYLLCKYGGIKKRLPVMVGIGLVGIAWFILWTTVYFIVVSYYKKKPKKGKLKTIILVIEILVWIGIASFYGYKIYNSAINYNGKLFWLFEDKKTSVNIKLKDNNFFQDGIDGVLNDMDQRLDLPDVLYMTNTVQVNVNADGIITSLDAFLYGKDSDGNLKSYLITYDSDKSAKMKVILDGEVGATFYEQSKLSPMQDMINLFVKSEEGIDYFDSNKKEGVIYSFQYRGCVTEDEKVGGYSITSDDYLGHTVWSLDADETRGYLIDMSIDQKRSGFLVSGDCVTVEDMATEVAKESEEYKQYQYGDVKTDEQGTMSFYLNNVDKMTLSVKDAAAGSRFYSFKGPQVKNADPFAGEMGVAEGMLFMDEETGFAVLSSGSGDYSNIFYTTDGGADFTHQELPVEDGADDILGNEFGYTTDEFGYIGVPYEQDGTIYVRVSLESSSVNEFYMLFSFDTQSESWEYQSYVSM